jgi:oligoribonuclease
MSEVVVPDPRTVVNVEPSEPAGGRPIASPAEHYLVWMDMEMTGLDPERDRIIEIATVITDGELRVVAEGPELVVHQDASVLGLMDEWNQKHHGESGLIARVQASTCSESQAEAETLAFIQRHCPAKKVPLAGSSIYQDRRFLAKYMPRIHEYLHYRNVDVSTVKELLKRWRPAVIDTRPPKKGQHRALADILDSIDELRHYRAAIFG